MSKYVFNTKEGNNGELEEQKEHKTHSKQIAKYQM